MRWKVLFILIDIPMTRGRRFLPSAFAHRRGFQKCNRLFTIVQLILVELRERFWYNNETRRYEDEETALE